MSEKFRKQPPPRKKKDLPNLSLPDNPSPFAEWVMIYLIICPRQKGFMASSSMLK